MTYLQLIALMDEAGMSPEEFGELLGISGMTLRRWCKKKKREKIPKLYVPAIREAGLTLIRDGRVAADSAAAQALLLDDGEQFQATLRHLGLPSDFTPGRPQSMINGLTQIGSQAEKRDEVESGRTKIFSFKKLGDDWSRRISLLWRVLHDKNLASIDKLIAYGALFYLLTPVDFIPDHIPFLGLVDDFAVLGVASAYYRSRHPEACTPETSEKPS